MSAEPIVVEATGLRAVFQRAGDRWSHHVELTDNSAVSGTIVMHSIEGSADEYWPPSPAIQQFSFQREPNGTSAAMGVGMSGRSHWSFSCRALSLGSLGQNEARYLQFDVACRVYEGFRRIGSCYRVLPEVAPTEQPRRVTYQIVEGEWCVTSQGVDVICNANQTLRMDYFGELEMPLPQTVQWSYRIARSGKTMFELSTH